MTRNAKNKDLYRQLESLGTKGHFPEKQSSPAKSLEPGDKMPDGTIFAGISPTTGEPMYALPVAQEKLEMMQFNEAAASVAEFNNASANGHNDWRIPTAKELDVLYDNRLKGGLGEIFGADRGAGTGGWYWSSTFVKDAGAEKAHEIPPGLTVLAAAIKRPSTCDIELSAYGVAVAENKISETPSGLVVLAEALNKKEVSKPLEDSLVLCREFSKVFKGRPWQGSKAALFAESPQTSGQYVCAIRRGGGLNTALKT